MDRRHAGDQSQKSPGRHRWTASKQPFTRSPRIGSEPSAPDRTAALIVISHQQIPRPEQNWQFCIGLER
jgi:hypothetical protein